MGVWTSVPADSPMSFVCLTGRPLDAMAGTVATGETGVSLAALTIIV